MPGAGFIHEEVFYFIKKNLKKKEKRKQERETHAEVLFLQNALFISAEQDLPAAIWFRTDVCARLLKAGRVVLLPRQIGLFLRSCN